MAISLAFAVITQSVPAQTPSPVKAQRGQALCPGDPSWTAPQKPLRIYGNTWYVGSQGLTVLLITSATGHVLIDGGAPTDVPLIEANLRSLGIHLRDIRWILNSHAHCDHAGGLAQLARDTGAQVMAGAADVPLLERGGHDDPAFGNRLLFPPVRATRPVTDGEILHLGNLTVTAHATPGHTPGNTTWTWESCEGRRCLHLVDVASLSAPGYQLLNNPKLPGVVSDFERSFSVVAALPCDIAVAPHPQAVNLWDRLARREQGDAAALIDPAGCRAAASAARKMFAAQLVTQRAKAGSATSQ